MRGLAAAVAHMKLVDTKAVVEAGKRAFHLGIEFRDNPRRSEVERKCWENGWKAAEKRWTDLLKRRGGYLGMRSSLVNPTLW